MSDKLYNAYNQEIELTTEQKACLKYTGDRTLMVKGFAGAGKSLVLMAAATKYIQKYGHEQHNKVAIFTYQNTLVSTTREFLKVNGDEDGIKICTVNSYMKDIYDELVELKRAPKITYPNVRKKDGDKPKRLKAVEMALKNHKKDNEPHRFHDIPVEFWLEEFDWMKDMNIGMGDLDAYVLYKRKGRGSKYRFSSADYIVAFEIYTYYLEYQSSTGQGDWADQPMFIVRNPNLIPDKYKFDHILIDEAQDLSLAQMAALMTLYNKNGDMIVAMDANQKIHGKYWTPKMLGIASTTKKLTKSMRTTKQIDDLAESVRSKNDAKLDSDDISIRAVPEREGAMPKLVHLEDEPSERKYVVNLIKTYMEANPNVTIGLIAAKKNQIYKYSDWLSSEGIAHEQVTKNTTFSMSNPGVKITSAYSAKGLEFNIVIIPMFADGYFPYSYVPDDKEAYEQFMIQMRNLVYVSLTRAKNILVVTWYGKNGSRFIKDMDPSLYELEGSDFEIIAKEPEFDEEGNLVNPEHKYKRENNTYVEAVHKDESVPEEDNKKDSENKEGLAAFLEDKGLEVYDKRNRKGALWVVGDKEIKPILDEASKKFGAKWSFSKNGGRATSYRTSWFTTSNK